MSKTNPDMPLLDQVLISRGLSRELLATSILIDPFNVPGMEEVIRIILNNLDSQIAIFGDYDCDGICAAAVLTETLRKLGNDPIVRLPNRDEGYGIRPFQVKELAECGTKLIITVDNGIVAHEAVGAARELGVKIVITDHHEPQETLPNCPATDPKLPGSEFREFSGTGVAYLLSCALLQAKGMPSPDDLLDLVALATVVDCCPITGPNYALARKGLLQMRKNPRRGINVLASVSGLKKYDGYSLAWQLGPRINAAGRMDNPDLAYELLTTDSTFTALALAGKLDSLNRKRQELVSQATEECLSKYNGSDFPVFVTDYPHGVVGVVAGRIAESIKRPVIVGTNDAGTVTASARSIGEFDLLGALVDCQRQTGLLGKLGGHRQAAGLSFNAKDLSKIQQILNETARQLLKPEDLVEWVDLDGVITHTPTLEEVRELDLLEPHGMGNPTPVFALNGKVEYMNFGETWKLLVLNGLKFFVQPDFPAVKGDIVHAAITPIIDDYRGFSQVAARAMDIRKYSISRNDLADSYIAWRQGAEVDEQQERIFVELGLQREGNNYLTTLLFSETFRRYGILTEKGIR